MMRPIEMSDARAKQIAEFLFPPPVWQRALYNVLLLAGFVLLGYVLGTWRQTARFDPPRLGWPMTHGLHTEVGDPDRILVRFLNARPEISRDSGRTWRECQ
jgi:hypothetical protein